MQKFQENIAFANLRFKTFLYKTKVLYNFKKGE